MSKICLHCNRELSGRSDRKFCHDRCRNAFRKEARLIQEQQEQRFVDDIILARKNHSILLQSFARLKPDDSLNITSAELDEMGYKLNVCTMAYISVKGELIRKVYEFELCEQEEKIRVSMS